MNDGTIGAGRGLAPTFRTGAALTVIAALLSACGGGGSTPQPTPPPPVSSAPTPAPTPAPPPAPTPAPAPPPTTNFNTAEFRRSDGAAYHGAVTAWQAGATGAGITVGVIDSGFDADAPEFAGRFHPLSGDVAGGTGRGFDDLESDGHGTNVAAVLLAARNDRATLGIAYDATLLALRADRPGSCVTTGSDDESGCRFSDIAIAAGVDRAILARARVINISLGGSSPSTSLREAVARAAAAGIVVVISAGNDGDSTEAGVDPANPDPFAQGLQAVGNGHVIIAGSNDDNGAISAFSNRAGSFAAAYLLALGSRVCCDYENGDLRRETRPDGTFVFVVSGTSFSAPQIAGAAALLAQAFPNLTGSQIVSLLLGSARDAGAAGTDPVFGRGILDIARAFAPQGTTTLAGTTIALPLGSPIGGTSGPMGDAALRGGTRAVILDGYRRAYGVDIAGLLASAPGAAPLTAALAGRQRNFVAADAASSIAITLLPSRDDGPGRAQIGPLMLDGAGGARARLLAGSIVSRIAPGSRIGFAFARGADGIASAMRGLPGDAFLIADDAASDRLIGTAGTMASAWRQTVGGGWALTASAERGDVAGLLPRDRLGRSALLDRASPYARLGLSADRTVGPLAIGFGASLLDEDRTLLGARPGPSLGIGGGKTIFFDGNLRLAPGGNWHVAAQWREGRTRATGSGLAAAGGSLRSRSWSIDAARTGVIAGADRLALRIAQPLRVTSGGIALTLPVGYDYASDLPIEGAARLSLAPLGRETLVEAAWQMPLAGGPLAGGDVSLNAYWRNQPGHIAAAPDDLGAAIRFALGF